MHVTTLHINNIFSQVALPDKILSAYIMCIRQNIILEYLCPEPDIDKQVYLEKIDSNFVNFEHSFGYIEFKQGKSF